MKRLQLALVASWITVALATHAATVIWLAWPANNCGANCTEILKRSFVEELEK